MIWLRLICSYATQTRLPVVMNRLSRSKQILELSMSSLQWFIHVRKTFNVLENVYILLTPLLLIRYNLCQTQNISEHQDVTTRLPDLKEWATFSEIYDASSVMALA